MRSTLLVTRLFGFAVFLLMRSPWNRERHGQGSAVDVARPAGRTLGVVRETARLPAAERLRAPDKAGVLAFPSASSRSAGPIHGSGSIEAKFHDGFS